MNTWQEHLKAYRKKHPKMSLKDAMKGASKTYKGKKQKGGNAKLAREVYKNPSERGEVDGYKQVKGDKRRAVYEKDGKVIVALRGTDFRSGKDLKDDVVLATGLIKTTGRYKKDKKLVQEAIRKYGKENVSITGHSLAGKLAKDIGRELGVRATTYNKGATYTDTVQGLRDRVACKRNPQGKRCKEANLIQNYRVKNDPASLLGALDKNTRVVEQKEGENVHAVANFVGGKKRRPKRLVS